MKKIPVLILCAWLIVSCLFGGCGKTARKPAPNQPSPNEVQQTTDAEKREMASSFSNLATSINGVQKATIVVASTSSNGTGPLTGETVDTNGKLVVMAGLTLNPQVSGDSSQTNAIIEQVKQKIMAADQRVSEVLVTTNPDMIKKLQDIAAGVIQGQPFQSYAKDVNELNQTIRSQ